MGRPYLNVFIWVDHRVGNEGGEGVRGVFVWARMTKGVLGMYVYEEGQGC